MPAKILIIHGLNNNLDAFDPMKRAFEHLGYEVSALSLPGHGSNRSETKNVETAKKIFNDEMKIHLSSPVYIIAFSQGALYLQLWLQKHETSHVKAQVLLAPAIFIRHSAKLTRLFKTLPSWVFIISQLPKKLRRYSYLNVWEYRTLFSKAKEIEESDLKFKVPTYLLVDPKDELIDTGMIKREMKNRLSGVEVEFVERSYLKGKKPGKHHILFHPDYFSPDDWDRFIEKIDRFFRKKTNSEV